MVAFWLLLLHPRPLSLPLFHPKVSFIFFKKISFLPLPFSRIGTWILIRISFFPPLPPPILFSSLGLRHCERPCGGCLRQISRHLRTAAAAARDGQLFTCGEKGRMAKGNQANFDHTHTHTLLFPQGETRK